MKQVELEIPSEAAGFLREAIAQARGNEVYFLGKVRWDESQAVASLVEVEVFARGNNVSAPAIRSLNGAIPTVGLRGFCGETIHHTSSSPRCLSANRLIWRCPSWAGLNDPPRMPTRRPGTPKPRRINVGTVRAAPARYRAPCTYMW